MQQGPTTGASEFTAWRASRPIALAIRAVVVLAPLAMAFIGVRVASGLFLRPDGAGGLVLWVVQAGIFGAIVSRLTELQTRQLLPLATLFSMSMAFPDRAPSRFGVALRTGTIKQLQSKLDDVREHGLGDNETDAARNAIELVAALGKHDRLTRGHTERVRAYADLIGEELNLSHVDRLKLSWGVLLHDVGKLHVPAEILNKSGRPDPDEWEILKAHPTRGGELLEPLAAWLGPFRHAATQHHERWDGTGYPLGLAGNEISLAGRIAAVADAYDVITSKRTYKAPMSAAAARQELVDCSGTQFDPAIVRAFLEVSVGRQRSAGPLAWLADLPLGQLGTAATTNATMVAVGSVAAVGSVTMAAPAGQAPVTLAFTDVEPSAPPSTGAPILVDVANSTTTLIVTTTSAFVPTTTVAAPPTSAAVVSTSSEAPTSTTTTTAAPSTTTTTTAATTTTTTAPPSGVMFANNLYVNAGTDQTWDEAVATADQLGGHLVTITGAEENDFVFSTFGTENPVWLGMNDVAVEGTFEWVTGEPVVYTNWLGAEPNNRGNQDYAIMASAVGRWDDTFVDSSGWHDGAAWNHPAPPILTIVEIENWPNG